ncbi:tyrosine-type recombinase/integrase [Bradyrhizobium ottawaense]|uniref:tyrosine-type recombinase/integrase n=1 Tax=Bradyrhizobium ottawaense TaxID=931866 RepID=UPI0024C09206|nr:tyrosine-type recombinase/integrase [Bradyrhizobium ottawaense]
MRDAAHDAGLPNDSSPHGLRHAICVRLAEAGCTPHQIQAITGHDNLAEIETYTKAVSQKPLAQIAMDSLATPKTGLANFDPKILKLLDVLALPSGIEPATREVGIRSGAENLSCNKPGDFLFDQSQ